MTSPRKSVSPMNPSTDFLVVTCWTWMQAFRPGLVTRSCSRMMKL